MGPLKADGTTKISIGPLNEFGTTKVSMGPLKVDGTTKLQFTQALQTIQFLGNCTYRDGNW